MKPKTSKATTKSSLSFVKVAEYQALNPPRAGNLRELDIKAIESIESQFSTESPRKAVPQDNLFIDTQHGKPPLPFSQDMKQQVSTLVGTEFAWMFAWIADGLVDGSLDDTGPPRLHLIDWKLVRTGNLLHLLLLP